LAEIGWLWTLRCRRGGVGVAELIEGQDHHGRATADMLHALDLRDILFGDAAYDSNTLRQSFAAPAA
jgi:hypothetical protein